MVEMLSPFISLRTTHVYRPPIDAVVMYNSNMLMRLSDFSGIVKMLTLFFPDTSSFPSGSVQVILGIGRPAALQVKFAVEGDVTV